jgi:hypothetical protein
MNEHPTTHTKKAVTMSPPIQNKTPSLSFEDNDIEIESVEHPDEQLDSQRTSESFTDDEVFISSSSSDLPAANNEGKSINLFNSRKIRYSAYYYDYACFNEPLIISCFHALVTNIQTILECHLSLIEVSTRYNRVFKTCMMENAILRVEKYPFNNINVYGMACKYIYRICTGLQQFQNRHQSDI